MMEFGYWTTGASLFPMDLSFTSNPLLLGILSTAGAAARQTVRHLDLSGFPVDFQIMFMEPRMSENELWFSKVGDSKKSLFGVVSVLE